MKKKKTTMTVRISLDDKEFLKYASEKSDTFLSTLVVDGAIKEAHKALKNIKE